MVLYDFNIFASFETGCPCLFFPFPQLLLVVLDFLVPLLNGILVVAILLEVTIDLFLKLVTHLSHQVGTRFQALPPFEHFIFFEEVGSDVELAAVVREELSVERSMLPAVLVYVHLQLLLSKQFLVKALFRPKNQLLLIFDVLEKPNIFVISNFLRDMTLASQIAILTWKEFDSEL